MNILYTFIYFIYVCTVYFITDDLTFGSLVTLRAHAIALELLVQVRPAVHFRITFMCMQYTIQSLSIRHD